MLKKENDAHKQENRMLRDKMVQLNQENEAISKQKGANQKVQVLESEINHLRQQLNESERESQKQLDYFRTLLSEKDGSSAKQKNEWAEIYGNMKQEIEDLKQEGRLLAQELEKQQQMGGNKQNEKELAKKLKKRELECSALWETLKDMHISARNIFDARQMLDLLALRALDTKAKRKLKI